MGTPDVVIKLSRSGKRCCDFSTVVSSQRLRSSFNCFNVSLSKSVPCSTPEGCISLVPGDLCSSILDDSSPLSCTAAQCFGHARVRPYLHNPLVPTKNISDYV